MQEALHDVHHQQHTNGGSHPNKVTKNGQWNADDWGTSLESADCLGKEDLSELGMSQRQGPESQVRGSVGNGPKNELDGLDHLVNHDFSGGLVLFSSIRAENLPIHFKQKALGMKELICFTSS